MFNEVELSAPALSPPPKGERQRERVLSDAEIKLYLEACEQPWRDCAIIMLGTGARPGEVFALRWERIQLNGSGGLLQITEGKSRAARRMLPLVPVVFQPLKNRWKAAGEPEQGWVFPGNTVSGRLKRWSNQIWPDVNCSNRKQLSPLLLFPRFG